MSACALVARKSPWLASFDQVGTILTDNKAFCLCLCSILYHFCSCDRVMHWPYLIVYAAISAGPSQLNNMQMSCAQMSGAQ